MTMTQLHGTTSLAFAATWRRYRVETRPSESGKPNRNTLVLMGEYDGRGLVKAGAIIEVGDEVYLEDATARRKPSTQYRVVAAIDKDSRAAIGEWLISWAQVPAQRDGENALAVTLDPERFTDIMLTWIHQDASDGEVDLADFAPGDISLDCAMALADDLCAAGLLRREPDTTVVSLTAEGTAAAQTAVIDRNNRTRRTEALQMAIIMWIYEWSEEDGPRDLRHFLYDHRATFHGRFFTETELYAEFAYLTEKGTVRHGSSWWHRPTLTADGRDCAAYHGGNVHESMTPKPTPTGNMIFNTGSGNQIAIGDSEQHQYAPPATTAGAAADTQSAVATPDPAAQPAAKPETQRAKFKAFATSTAGVITFLCAVVVAVFTVLIYFTTIK